jgi:Adaptin N terminal region
MLLYSLWRVQFAQCSKAESLPRCVEIDDKKQNKTKNEKKIMSRKKHEDHDELAYMPFEGIDKGLVLQEKRVFGETPVDAANCCHLLTKILYLLSRGETFTKTEATDVFFAVTKLFQSDDIILRRLVYLVLKELAPFAQDVIIIVSRYVGKNHQKINFGQKRKTNQTLSLSLSLSLSLFLSLSL